MNMIILSSALESAYGGFVTMLALMILVGVIRGIVLVLKKIFNKQ